MRIIFMFFQKNATVVAIHACLLGLESRDFHSLDLVRSETNHNHEDIVESVEVYRYAGFKRIV